jgi:hypothetical protein
MSKTNLNDCGFHEYRHSDMHTNGLNKFLSVFYTFIVRVAESRYLRCAPNDIENSKRFVKTGAYFTGVNVNTYMRVP